MHQELDTCFPNVFCTLCILLECFLNTSRIHMDVTFRWSMKIILNMHNTFLELPNAVPCASVRSRTADMLLEHTKCFMNMTRSLPEHPNSYSENKQNGIWASVIGPLQLMPRQVHSWWLHLRKCHHLSVNEAVAIVASCSLAAVYQCFNDLGFSYILAYGWVKAVGWGGVGWMTH